MEKDILTFLKSELLRKKNKNPKYSLRSYARDLGVSPATLSKIISGQSLLTPKVFRKIKTKLPHDSKTLLKMENDLIRLKKERDYRSSIMSDQRKLNVAEFSLIYHWYYWAILETFALHDFQNSPEWIRKKLKLKNKKIVLDAFCQLEKVNLIKKTANGFIPNFYFVGEEEVFTSSEKKKEKQKQILKLSLKALDEIPVEIRSHSDLCIALDDSLIPIIKKKILRFNLELGKFINTKSKKMNKIYSFQIGFFPLSK